MQRLQFRSGITTDSNGKKLRILIGKPKPTEQITTIIHDKEEVITNNLMLVNQARMQEQKLNPELYQQKTQQTHDDHNDKISISDHKSLKSQHSKEERQLDQKSEVSNIKSKT